MGLQRGYWVTVLKLQEYQKMLVILTSLPDKTKDTSLHVTNMPYYRLGLSINNPWKQKQMNFSAFNRVAYAFLRPAFMRSRVNEFVWQEAGVRLSFCCQFQTMLVLRASTSLVIQFDISDLKSECFQCFFSLLKTIQWTPVAYQNTLYNVACKHCSFAEASGTDTRGV
jgi:hypothetical protein